MKYLVIPQTQHEQLFLSMVLLGGASAMVTAIVAYVLFEPRVALFSVGMTTLTMIIMGLYHAVQSGLNRWLDK